MSEPLTDLELDAMETENGQRAAAKIRELQRYATQLEAENERLMGIVDGQDKEDNLPSLRAELRELRAIPRLRFWNCPCGDLVIRDEHYDLECGKCKSVQIDENEFKPDFEIHKLRAEIRELREALKKHGRHIVTCGFELTRYASVPTKPCDCGLDSAPKGARR